jgi:ribosomal protein S18 acetylase RimI-like enzyme
MERKRSWAELDPNESQRIIEFWNPKLAQKRMDERFAHGASLWVVLFDGELAGYGWTLRGRTIEPYFLPLGPDDIHFFDFHVFPAYRGRGLNPLLVKHILASLRAEGGGRAWIEAAEWNAPQRSSLQKTPFLRLGLAKKWTIFGRPIVCWAEGNVTRQARERLPYTRLAAVTERSTSELPR